MDRQPVHALLLASCVLLAFARPAVAEPAIPAKVAPLLRDDHDQLIARAFVPSPDQKVGEVRLLRRGDADVVQTLLYTKILRRVVGEIRKKELANWPDGVEGHADAERYADALAQAQEEIWDRLPKFERGADPRQKLLIEFVLSADVAAVLLAEYHIEEVGGDVGVTARRPLALLEPSRQYVHRNMQLIVADAFKVPEDDLRRVLGSLSLVAAPLSTAPAASAPAEPRRK